MSWERYLQLIRKQSTSLEEWQAAVQTSGDQPGELGAAMYDALDEARRKGQVFRGLATLMLHFVDQAGKAAALQQRVEDLERDAREAADVLDSALERVTILANEGSTAQYQADECRSALRRVQGERDALRKRVAELETAEASTRTEVLFLQDRISEQSTYEGLQELFQRQQEIADAIQRTAEVVFAPDTTVYWEHNGHTQRGRVQRMGEVGDDVWVKNANTNVTRLLDIGQLRTEAIAADAVYPVETADVA